MIGNFNYVTENTFADVKSEDGTWRVCRILQVQNDEVRFILDGYGIVYNLKLGQNRLAPFRRFTNLYTGPSIPQRMWNFTPEELTENISQVSKLIQEGFEILDAFEAIQYLRGSLPIFIENLLEYDYGTDTETISKVVTFLEQVLKMIINYYNWFSTKFLEYEESLKNPDLQQTSKIHALSSCLFDMIDSNEKLLNLQPRCRRLFSIINPSFPTYEISSNLQDRNEYSSIFLHLTDHFISLCGFESLIQLIAKDNSPISLLNKSLLHIFKDFINSEKYEKLNLELMNAVKFRINSLSDKDLKIIEAETIQRLFTFGLTTPSEVDMSKKLLIEFYIKLLKSSYLEKRIKGINEISAFCESILTDQEQMVETSKILQKGSVLSEVLETRPHLEILKRAASTIKVFSMSQMITAHECKLLLNFTRSENRSESETGYKIIEEIFEFLDFDLQNSLFECLENLNLSQINFSVLTQLSLKTFSKLQTFRIEPFLMQLLENSSAGGRMTEVVESLKKIYNSDEGKASAMKFLENFPNLLESSSSVVQSIQISLHILSSFDKDSLNSYIKTCNLKQVLLKNLLSYLESPEEESSTQRIEKISNRLRILGFIMFRTDYEVHLETSELTELWNRLVKNPKTPKDTQVFLPYLGSTVIRESLINDSVQVFKTFFLDHEKLGSNLNPQEINAFRVFFIRANENNCFVVKDNQLKGVKAGNILGIEKCFAVFLNSDTSKSPSFEKMMFTLFTIYEASLQNEIQKIFSHHLELFIQQVNFENEKTVESALKFFNILLEVNKPEENLQKYFLFIGDKYEEIMLPQITFVRTVRKAIAHTLQKPLSHVSFKNEDSCYSDIQDFQKIRLKPENFLQFIEVESGLIDFCPSEFLGMSDFFYSFIFQDLLKSKKYQEKTWKFLKNLPVRFEYSEKLRTLSHSQTFPRDPHEYFHCFTLFKHLAGDLTWQENFKNSQIRKDFLIFVLNNRKTAEFLLVQDELYVEILSYLEIEDFLLKPVLEDLLEVHQKSLLPALIIENNSKAFPAMSFLENVPRFFENILKIFNFYKENHFQEFLEICEKNLEALIEIIISLLPSLEVKSRLYMSIEKTLKIVIFSTNHCKSAFRMMFHALDSSHISLEGNPKFFFKFLLSITKSNQVPSEDLEKARDFITKQIQSLKEETTTCNQVLRFSLKLLKNINNQVPHLEISQSDLELTFKHLLLGETNNSPTSLCKNRFTRASAYRYLLSIATRSNFFESLSFINSFFSTLHWRSSKNWSIYFSQREKTCEYSGLRNLGNTCYMNSLLQQLFFIESFSSQILSLSDEDSELVSFQLKKIFIKLKYLNGPFSSTKSLCQNFKDFEDRPINPLEQMDVDEFYCKLMDKLENDLRNSGLSMLVQEHFRLVSAVEMISECSDRSERHENMLSVPIEVKNKKDLLDSLSTLVKGEVMTGENAYFCERCSKKVTSLRRTSFKFLPNFLVFSLRRFEFNYDFMVRNKLNDYFEFPFELNMKEFTTEYLNQEPLAKDEYYLYSLKGVVVHVGRAEQGHYYSFINVNSQWIEFNDTLVTPVRPETVKEKAFGRNGDVVLPTAYLLVYERQTKFEINQKIKQKTWGPVLPKIDENYVNCKNYKLWMKKIVLSHDFLKFQISLSRIGDSFEVYLNYFLTVLVRVEHHYREKFYILRSILKGLNQEVSEYILEVLCSTFGILEFFLTCSNNLSRKLVLLLLKKSLETLPKERIEIYLEHLIVALPSLTQNSIQSEYLEAIFYFSLKVPEKVEEIKLIELIVNFLHQNQIQVKENHLKTDKLGYSGEYKFRINNVNDSISNSRMFAFEILRAFLPALTEHEKDFLKREENQDTFLKYLNTRDLRYFSHFYRDLLHDDAEGSLLFVFKYLNTMHETSHQNREYYRVLIFQFLEHHKLRAVITSKFMEYFLSIIPENNSDEFEFFVNFLLKILSGVDFPDFFSILEKSKINHLLLTAETMKFYVFQQNQYPNLKIVKIIEKLNSLPMIEVIRDIESGFPEDHLNPNNPILIFDAGRKAWFEGKILEILDNSLVLVEYFCQSSRLFAIKSILSDELYPKF